MGHSMRGYQLQEASAVIDRATTLRWPFPRASDGPSRSTRAAAERVSPFARLGPCFLWRWPVPGAVPLSNAALDVKPNSSMSTTRIYLLLKYQLPEYCMHKHRGSIIIYRAS